MQSGIVYFEEIVENIKDITGIENMRPLYDKIRRFVFNAEYDIAAGGTIVRKRKDYVIGDGYYDGYNIIMPEDFVGEQSCKDLSGGTLAGNVLTMSCLGPDAISIYYLGYLLDNNGNPFTTRNHLTAVTYHARFKLYSSKVFLGVGASQSMYQEFKHEYNDEVMAARGNDAFPTEEEWSEIGRTMNGGIFEALTNCGMMCVGEPCNDTTATDGGGSVIPGETSGELLSCNIVSVFNASLVDPYTYTPLPTNLGSIQGIATVTGMLSSYTQLIQGQSNVSATLGARVSMSGSASGSSSIS